MNENELLQPYDPENDRHQKLLKKLEQETPPATIRPVFEQEKRDPYSFRAGGSLEAFIGKLLTSESTASAFFRGVYFGKHPVHRTVHRIVGIDRINMECPGCHKVRWRLALVTNEYWIMDCIGCRKVWWVETGGKEGRKKALELGETLASSEALTSAWNQTIIEKARKVDPWEKDR